MTLGRRKVGASSESLVDILGNLLVCCGYFVPPSTSFHEYTATW